jgi:hypothetical protein
MRLRDFENDVIRNWKPGLNKESTVQASMATMLRRIDWPVTK